MKQPWHLWKFLEGRRASRFSTTRFTTSTRYGRWWESRAACTAAPSRIRRCPSFEDTRSTIILDYGNALRCSLLLNHTHQQQGTHGASFLKVEGTKGAAQLTLGVNIDYPNGPRDTLEVALENGRWQPVALRGSWFIEAFEGPMSNLQRFVAGEDAALVSPVDDAIRTMALVEACYQSSASGGTPIPEI